MRLLRFKVWWLMVLVAVVALGCWAIPPWWNWHHEMLKRSEFCSSQAVAIEQHGMRFTRQVAGQPSETMPAAGLDALARAFRRAATFPWLDEPSIDRYFTDPPPDD